LIKNNNHTQFFDGHDPPSHYVAPLFSTFPASIVAMPTDKSGNAGDSGKIVFWNNVKLQ
jgi:hypothetical protein